MMPERLVKRREELGTETEDFLNVIRILAFIDVGSTASLFQWPRSMMLCLEMPLRSAVTAAPLHREWPD